MPVTVIVGGQFGGEGKGKVAHFLAQEMNARVAIRIGGTNSGHTVIDPSGNPIILRQLPTPSILPEIICVLGAGTYIDPDVLLKEIDLTGLNQDRLVIDPNAMIITKDNQRAEENSSLRVTIGSTLSGTGEAVKRRITRNSVIKFAKNEERLQPYIKPVSSILRDIIKNGDRVIVEGTQGFGLSLLHSPYYPYCTSRDTTAAAFISEAGLSPLDVDEIVMVLRAFPIRVGGNSGPLPNEIDWDTITAESKNNKSLIEFSSVSKTIRRIARFDAEIVRKAIDINRPTHIVLNHLDYVDSSMATCLKKTEKINSFILQIEELINHTIDYIGLGPAKLIHNSNSQSRVSINE